MLNAQSKRLSVLAVSVMFLFISPVSNGSTAVGSNSFIQNLTKSIGDNFTMAVNVTTSNQTDALDKQAKEEEERCAAGEEGTQGAAIDDALKIHIELGAAQPDVEKLFDVAGDCFSKLNKLYDLSFSIPSLSTIMNSAQEAVLDYAKQKACTAVNQASQMVTSPINQAIDKVNSKYSQYFNLNGLANSTMQNGMSKLDPNLGKEYMSGPTAGDYTIVSFSGQQTTFETGPTSAPAGSNTSDQNQQNIRNLQNQVSNLSGNSLSRGQVDQSSNTIQIAPVTSQRTQSTQENAKKGSGFLDSVGRIFNH